jgi:UrcA family protein
MIMKNAVLALAACAVAVSAPAYAASNPFAKDQAVLQLSGLDLSTVEGQQRLAIRMDEAARAVCGDRLSSIHVELGEKARDCRTAVLSDIRAQIETRMAAKASGTQLAYNR